MPRNGALIKKVGIITKHNIKNHADFLAKLVSEIKRQGREVLFDRQSGPLMHMKPSFDKTTLLRKCDLVIVLGGDGTLLKTARAMCTNGSRTFTVNKHECHKPFIAGVNMGHLGFLTGFTPKRMLSNLPKILAGKFCPDERFLLRVTLYRNGKKRHTTLALNEAVINQGGFARLINLRVEINQRELANYRADGLLISTPTGSTGHSLSAGGPIIHPRIEGILLTPLCPVKLGVRPIIIPNSRQLIIRLETQWRAERKPIVLTIDGQITINLKKDDVLRIRKSSRTFNMIRMSGHNFYRMLRQKLNWGA